VVSVSKIRYIVGVVMEIKNREFNALTCQQIINIYTKNGRRKKEDGGAVEKRKIRIVEL